MYLGLGSLLSESVNLVIDNGNLGVELQQLLLHHVLVLVVTKHAHRTPLALGNLVHERFSGLVLTRLFQMGLVVYLGGVPGIQIIVAMLACPAEEGEHDGAWDDVARTAEQKAKIAAGEGAGNGRGTKLVGCRGIQISAHMGGSAAGDVPPVEQAGVVQDGGADGPEGGANGEPLCARDNGEEDGGVGAQGAVEGADDSARDCWGVLEGMEYVECRGGRGACTSSAAYVCSLTNHVEGMGEEAGVVIVTVGSHDGFWMGGV